MKRHMFSVTIDETNNIIHEVSQNFGIDLSGMATASLRLRISNFCRIHHLQSPGIIVSMMHDDSAFIELFMHGISVGSPDMFRDPELWISLRDLILPVLVRDSKSPRIHIPGSVSGDELYSMAILLKESGLEKKIHLGATCINNSIRRDIEMGLISKGRYKNSLENYLVYQPGSTLEKYMVELEGRQNREPGLLKQGTIKVEPYDQPGSAGHANLVLYRNRMIYFNKATSHLRFLNLFDSLATGSIIVIGIRESLEVLGIKDGFDIISPDLKIYAKTG